MASSSALSLASVRIAGLQTVRLTTSLKLEDETPGVYWRILPVGDPKLPSVLVADLKIATDHNFAAVTVIADLVLDPKLMKTWPDENGTEVAEWATDVLYDFAASALRSSLASAWGELTVPKTTPPMTVWFD